MAKRMHGHALKLSWSGEYGSESTSTGACKCGTWSETCSSQREVRNEYGFHLEDVAKRHMVAELIGHGVDADDAWTVVFSSNLPAVRRAALAHDWAVAEVIATAILTHIDTLAPMDDGSRRLTIIARTEAALAVQKETRQ